MPIGFIIPEKFCPKCGGVIPLNGYELDGMGNAVVDEHMRPIYHKNPLLICENCARKAMAPKAPRKRRKKGEVDEGQLSLCDRPDLKYVGQKYGSGKDE